MEISKKLTGETLFDPTLYAEDIPASHSAKPAKDSAPKTLDISGRGFAKQLANYDPTSQSWRMCEVTLASDSLPFSAKWPSSGMTRNGVLYQLPAWERLISATESLSWPTPTAVTRPMEGNVRMYRAKIEAGEMTEEEAKAILGKSVWEAQGKVPMKWSTPTTQETEHPEAVITPTGRRLSKDGKTSHSLGLADQVRMWPTPTRGKLCEGSGANQKIEEKFQDGEISLEEKTAMQAGNGGKLNPTWVEWLMGFPLGWTDLSA